MSDIEYRHSLEGVELRASGDGRTVDLFLVPFNRPQRINSTLTEQFDGGAFRAQQDNLSRVPLAWGHLPHGGKVVGKMTELRSGNGGLVGTGVVSKTSAGDDLLALLSDGAIPPAVSIGFRSMVDRKAAGGVVIREQAFLTEVAFVQQPAYHEAMMVAMREQEDSIRTNLRAAQLLRRGLPRRLA